MFCQTKFKNVEKYEHYKNGKNWLRIDPHCTQCPVRFDFFLVVFKSSVCLNPPRHV